MLHERGCKTSFRTKDDAITALNNLVWFKTFPWHDEQRMVLDAFEIMDWKELVVQGIFGNGKTTLMLGLFFQIWYDHKIPVDQIVMCAFNVCIKNELHRRLRDLCIKKRPMIRTFDSIVYSVCERLGCPDLDKPNYEGRRRFLEQSLIDRSDVDLFLSKKWVFIDESQDLDGRCRKMLHTIFPNARFVYFGDVFQCIQKEPRTCLLWKLLETDDPLCRVFWMKKTPRVPAPILAEIQSALSRHYPEHRDLFQQWVSINPVRTPENIIRWECFRSYKQIFRCAADYVEEHGATNTMILVFSSAITVRGGLGDVARFRHFFESRGMQVNSNYKRMEPDKLFLSTVNSSKGLERDYVFLVLTFPLELAFANFSNDLVVNLVSVGLSRCKKQVIFYVPTYKDRESHVLQLYETCPRATETTETFSSRKGMRESFVPAVAAVNAAADAAAATGRENRYQVLEKNAADFFEQDHSTTEVIRQGIVTYTTRLECLAFTRFCGVTSIFPEQYTDWLKSWRSEISQHVRREEQRALFGVVMEHVLCSWRRNEWPPLSSIGIIDDNPLASHCKGSFLRAHREYTKIVRRASYTTAPPTIVIHALYLYSQCSIMVQNKVNVALSEKATTLLTEWYTRLAPIIRSHGTCQMEEHTKIQHHLKMPCISGIADGFVAGDISTKAPSIVYEIKGCTMSGWHEDALFQAFLYFVMAGKSTGRIILLNPVRNERREYNVRIPKFYTLRYSIIRDALLWNTNCFLAKISGTVNSKMRNPLLLIVEDPDIGITVLDRVANTSARILFHGYIHHDEMGDSTKRSKNNLQSSSTADDLKETVDKIMQWFYQSHRIVRVRLSREGKITTDALSSSVESIMSEMQYCRSSEPNGFSISFHDPFVVACLLLMYVSVAGDDVLVHARTHPGTAGIQSM